MEYIISCCSSVDLSAEELKDNEISFIPMHYFIDDVEYYDDLFESVTAKEFYKKMNDGCITKTSQVNAEEYYNYFEKFIKEGKGILHICLSSGITGTMNSARSAKEMLLEKYPDAEIRLVDSLCASCGYGFVCLKAAENKKNGLTLDENLKEIEKYKGTVEQWFFTSDLTYYVRGGRLSAVSGWFGTMLKICPLLEVDKSGKLIPREKCRGKQKAINSCFEKMKELITDKRKYSGKCYIANSDCYDDASALKALIEDEFPKLRGKVKIVDVGVIIGSHTGPGTTGLFFEGE